MKSNLSTSIGCPRWYTLSLSLLLLAAMSVIMGCRHHASVVSEGGGNATNIDPVGNYALVSVDGKNVPCALQHGGHSLTIKSGSFAIGADGTCTSKNSFLSPAGREATREVRANYTRQGNKLTMKWHGAGTTVGTVEANSFAMNNEGSVFAYRK